MSKSNKKKVAISHQEVILASESSPLGSSETSTQKNDMVDKPLSFLHKDLIDVYTSYITRITAHYTIGLEQFKIYFGFNAGLVALLGFILKPYFEKPQAKDQKMAFPLEICLLLVGASIVGLILTRYWRIVMINSKNLQMHFNQTLELCEKSLFTNPKDGFYSRLNQLFPVEKRPKGDLIDVNVQITWLFTWMWAIMALMAALTAIKPELIGWLNYFHP